MDELIARAPGGRSAAARFAGCRVLLTGASGFKGAWLARWLTLLGAEVHGLGLPPDTAPSLYDQLGLAGQIHWTELDIRDRGALAAHVRAVRPTLVFHLAAAALVRASYSDPVGTVATNVMGSLHLLDALRGLDQPVGVVMVTSDKCYAIPGDGRARVEADALGGEDPYSASKAATELVTASMRQSYFPPSALDQHGVAIATARAGNVIGPGDHAADRLVPDCMRALARGLPIEVRNPHARRPWQHVLEPLWGYLLLGARLHPDAGHRARFSEAFNLGPAEAATVGTVVDLVVRAHGSGSWHHLHRPTDPAEVSTLLLDSSKAAAALGWRPVWTVHEAVSHTVRGYQRLVTATPREARALLDEQIHAFSVALRGGDDPLPGAPPSAGPAR